MPHSHVSAGKGVHREGRGTYNRYKLNRTVKGNVFPNGDKSIVIRFTGDTFDEIRARAEKQQMPFAELVRTYCEWGLENGDDT